VVVVMGVFLETGVAAAGPWPGSPRQGGGFKPDWPL